MWFAATGFKKIHPNIDIEGVDLMPHPAIEKAEVYQGF